MMVSGSVIRSTAFRIILVALGMVALGACRSTPKPADAAAPAKPVATEKVDEAAKPEKKQGVAVEPQKKDEGQKARPTGFRWPWQKKPGKEDAAPKGDKAGAAAAEEELPSGYATPAATEETVEAAKPEKKRKAGLFAGFRWPWQKKRPAAAEPEGKTEPPLRDEGLPLSPVPDPGQIAPRVPEPGLAPVDAPAPREPRPDDPLSGIGLYPGT